MLTKSFFFNLDKLVDLNVWGIIQVSKVFLLILDIVKDIPLIKIDAFSTKYFINLELPLKNGQNISGHICQGHVDYVSKLKKIKSIDKSYLMEFSANNAQKKNLIEKASILINGVSLTISKITKSGFEVWIIPHTYNFTNLSKLRKNSLVNIEVDILSKYVKKYFNEK